MNSAPSFRIDPAGCFEPALPVDLREPAVGPCPVLPNRRMSERLLPHRLECGICGSFKSSVVGRDRISACARRDVQVEPARACEPARIPEKSYCFCGGDDGLDAFGLSLGGVFVFGAVEL